MRNETCTVMMVVTRNLLIVIETQINCYIKTGITGTAPTRNILLKSPLIVVSIQKYDSTFHTNACRKVELPVLYLFHQMNNNTLENSLYDTFNIWNTK